MKGARANFQISVLAAIALCLHGSIAFGAPSNPAHDRDTELIYGANEAIEYWKSQARLHEFEADRLRLELQVRTSSVAIMPPDPDSGLRSSGVDPTVAILIGSLSVIAAFVGGVYLGSRVR